MHVQIDKWDEDKDGEISKEEFVTMMTKIREDGGEATGLGDVMLGTAGDMWGGVTSAGGAIADGAAGIAEYWSLALRLLSCYFYWMVPFRNPLSRSRFNFFALLPLSIK